ncbi:11371_t:CDS:1, partial [Gigaspora margarita]
LEANIEESEIKLRDNNKKYGNLLTDLEVIYAALEDNYKALQAKDGMNEEEIKNLKNELKETQDEKDKVENDLLKMIEEGNKEIKEKYGMIEKLNAKK